MVERMTISERDVHTMLRIVNSPDDRGTNDALPMSTMLGLYDLIPCDTVILTALDATRRESHFDVEVGASDKGLDWESLHAAFWRHYWDSSCAYPDLSGDVVTVTKASDFYTDRELRSTAMYTDYLRHFDGFRDLMVCFPTSDGHVVRVLFWRGRGRDFSERDRALLALLRPHLQAAYERQLRCQSPLRQLTVRQSELLRLVAAGHTNRQIARRLSIAEATVRKHLENVFERLHVDSRTAAVTSAFGYPPSSHPRAASLHGGNFAAPRYGHRSVFPARGDDLAD